ncbi:cation:proton antiporter [Streptomyces microflavus]|uniref:cation:proton antiporter domain-containing protein n=1 Tax=Streptomyces microflavus TaxID=1919 RepID=UPI0033C2BDC7
MTLSSGLASAPSCHTHVTESSSGSGEAGAQAPHQRSVDASGPGDTTPRIINCNKGGSHAGPEGRRPHCGATKKVTGGGEALLESLWQVLGAALLGVVAGWLGGKVLSVAEQHRTMQSGALLVYTLLLALLVLGTSGLLHVDGVLAVFVAGLAFNATSWWEERGDENKIDEAVNRFIVLPLFVALGAMIPWREWGELGWWRGALLILGALLLRRLPVLLALKRPLSLTWRDALFLGWFGPIGVSALFYLTMEAHRLGINPTVLAAGTLVVVASAVVHGITTAPGLALYRWMSERTQNERGTDQ